MRFNFEYPVDSHADAGAWIRPANIVRFARALEAAGVDGIAFTDHPAPTRKWLQTGGHGTFDPFAALAFCAAATERIRLMTRLVVVPYRNPLLQARSMMTVDVLSGGRATFVLGAGYLRAEFAALGVDFDSRLALFDEAVEAIKGFLREEEFAFEGRNFTASGQAMSPTVIQRPHPPFWLGGNSPRVLERIARWGQGWSVMFGPEQVARISKTRAISSLDDLAAALADLDRRLANHGRKLADVDVDISSDAADMSAPLSTQERVDRLGALQALGVTWAGLMLPGMPFGQALETVHRFGEEVASKTR
jgi:probable F420-dependent oxidoreductase